MKLTDRKQQFPIPWAINPDSGTLSPIPKEDPGDGSASLTKGFPKATMTPLAAGGKPPRGDQFNGIFNQLSLSAQNNDMGFAPAWSSNFAQAIGGYPQTAQVTVINNGIPDILVSLVDNNLDNPSDPKQTSWASIKKGLALSSDLSGYQPKGDYALESDIAHIFNGSKSTILTGFGQTNGTGWGVVSFVKSFSQAPVVLLSAGSHQDSSGAVFVGQAGIRAGSVTNSGFAIDTNAANVFYTYIAVGVM